MVSCAVDTYVASDGYVANYRRYMPKDEPRAHLVCVHGIQSHGGWYEYSCQRLAQAGYAVYYLDRRGSGLNQVDRGDAPSFRRLIDDVAEFMVDLKASEAPIPVVLVACSWGGKLGPALCRRHTGLMDGLILIGPGFFTRVRPTLKQRLGIAWSRLASPRRLFPIPLSDPALFTATPRWQEYIANDALSLRQATARLLAESVRLDMYLRFVPRWVTVPVLLMLAEHDRIIHNPPTRAYVERFATSDKQVIEYAGAHHTLEFEPNPDRFIDDLITWLRSHEKELTLRCREAEPALAAKALRPEVC